MTRKMHTFFECKNTNKCTKTRQGFFSPSTAGANMASPPFKSCSLSLKINLHQVFFFPYCKITVLFSPKFMGQAHPPSVKKSIVRLTLYATPLFYGRDMKMKIFYQKYTGHSSPKHKIKQFILRLYIMSRLHKDVQYQQPEDRTQKYR